MADRAPARYDGPVDAAADNLPFELTLRAGTEELKLRGSVPPGPLALADMVPMLQDLDDVVVAAAVREMDARGERISCGPGCGVCCRQLVPISEAEALYLARVVEAMPKKRRARVRERFAAAVASLDEAGLVDRLRESAEVATVEDLRDIGFDYFYLGIPCPFLERESCSIHPDRPLVCREYLVTSPPSGCAGPSAKTVTRVVIPNKVSAFLGTFSDGSRPEKVRWMPLVAALQWAASAGPQPVFSGQFLVERLVASLASR